jgi:hypothetical protein
MNDTHLEERRIRLDCPSTRKAWQTPVVVLSQLSETMHSVNPPTSDGTPASQKS